MNDEKMATGTGRRRRVGWAWMLAGVLLLIGLGLVLWSTPMQKLYLGSSSDDSPASISVPVDVPGKRAPRSAVGESERTVGQSARVERFADETARWEQNEIPLSERETLPPPAELSKELHAFRRDEGLVSRESQEQSLAADLFDERPGVLFNDPAYDPAMKNNDGAFIGGRKSRQSRVAEEVVEEPKPTAAASEPVELQSPPAVSDHVVPPAEEVLRDEIRAKLEAKRRRGFAQTGEVFGEPYQQKKPIAGKQAMPSARKADKAAPSPAPPAKDKLKQKPVARTGGDVGARHFLAQQEALEGVRFQQASGYWANTYTPGDPIMRLLGTRLDAWRQDTRLAGLPLEQTVVRNWQPFDPPSGAALALYLSADKASIGARTRLRVQVGLQGTARRGGQRPAMNVGLVLDLRAVNDERRITVLRALITALQRAWQPSDRFSLTVAGRPGGLLVPPERFRHGPLQLAVNQLFDGSALAGTPSLTLQQAVQQAAASVREADDPTAVLGSSLVLLVSAAAQPAELRALEPLAHQGAVAGVVFSVVALDGGLDPAAVRRLVLFGQGNQRALHTAAEAGGLIERELSASSRAVARALRLRIRLAAGVELIEVLGAQRLVERQVQRVREAERSVDRRMARNLGIKADRGEDEAGIQIVIPSFYADDTHVVLLDVVAVRPGPIADVRVRYKDLVYGRNGVASARLALPGGEVAPGPLQRNVLKNRLALELTAAAGAAGAELAAGRLPRAIETLRATHELYREMRAVIVGWSEDAELLRDERLLAAYLSALQRFPNRGDYLVDSLRYTALRKHLAAGPETSR